MALVSPIGALAQTYLFSAHMLQHLLLLLVVPPLALMSLPPADAAKRSAGGDGVADASKSRWRSRLPVVTWGIGVGAMWLWHARKLCDAASQSATIHRIQEVSLLMMGLSFYWPILAPRAASRLPPLGGVLYLFTACVACTILGIAITFSPVEVCSIYLH